MPFWRCWYCHLCILFGARVGNFGSFALATISFLFFCWIWRSFVLACRWELAVFVVGFHHVAKISWASFLTDRIDGRYFVRQWYPRAFDGFAIAMIVHMDACHDRRFITTLTFWSRLCYLSGVCVRLCIHWAGNRWVYETAGSSSSASESVPSLSDALRSSSTWPQL